MPDTAEQIEVSGAGGEAAAYVPVSPWRLQFRIIKALVLRDMSARHGDSRLGYFMGILMPLVTVAFIMLMFQLRGRLAPPEFPLSVFLVTGYPVWLAFQRTYNQVMNTAARADSLLAFPQITQLDLIVAQVILDGATDTIVYVILIGVVAILFGSPPANFGGVVILFWANIWAGVCLGLTLSALRRIVPTVVTILNMCTRLLMWVSGVLFTVDRLPPEIQQYLKWNPLLHVIEGLRHNWIATYDPPIYDPFYIVGILFILTMFGLSIERATRRYVGE